MSHDASHLSTSIADYGYFVSFLVDFIKHFLKKENFVKHAKFSVYIYMYVPLSVMCQLNFGTSLNF